MDSIEVYIEKNLSEKRRKHVYGVVETAGKLAERYGCDRKKAEKAALFHDMLRNAQAEVLNMYVRQLGLDRSFLDNANLAHGPVAAEVMKRDYGISDPDLLNAVRYHTTGRAGMSLLEKIVYLADAIEPGRAYPGVDEIRKIAEQSLDQACLRSMEHSIAYIRERGLFLHPDTVNACNELRKKGEKHGL
ncbi:bis(5'-nucleosyl)-tetraphosphatase (symmetrical) YqeK [bacterium 210820-DFI.6.37]|nr:bis(5'-nucleosyl)-tetraphosphatase (symmetrical) YqeK [bacterium 210820-DFI.6.37]